MFVKVSGEPQLNPGLSAKGTLAEMNYEITKPGAFLSRPLEQAKKVGLLSLSIRGTTDKSYVEQSSSTTGNMKTTTTTTTTLRFPQQSDKTWDGLLESLYPAFMDVLKSELKAAEVPVDKITGTEAYKSTVAFTRDDKNNKIEFSRSFRQTKVVSARMPMGEGYASNGVNQRIMKESGADSLVTLTLDLQIAVGKDGQVLMKPRLAYELVGKPNGSRTTNKYFTGTIDSTVGVSFTSNITVAQLETIVRKSDLMTVFRKALEEIKAKEKQNGDYDEVWNLQK